jgi:hypothetical protein
MSHSIKADRLDELRFNDPAANPNVETDRGSKARIRRRHDKSYVETRL